MKAPQPFCEKCNSKGFDNFKIDKFVNTMICLNCDARYKLLSQKEHNKLHRKGDEER